jgi:uncharacterized protein YjaG (DUF416 family)
MIMTEAGKLHYATFELAEFLQKNFEQLDHRQLITAMTCLCKQHNNVDALFVQIGRFKVEKFIKDTLQRGN